MKPELEGELFKKYPKIFNGTLIGKKIKCNDGWFHLLDSLSYDVQTYCDMHLDIPQVRAISVMRQSGGLRFYSIGGNQYLWKTIDQAETKSTFTCEECGDLGKTVFDGPHIKCLCQSHIR